MDRNPINPINGEAYTERYFEILEKRRDLPAWESKKPFQDLLRGHQTIVVTGETGSGKSTQCPQWCLDYAESMGKTVGVTQPRVVAARSLAKRVSEEMDVSLGREVGFSVRREDCCDRQHTKIKFMTDGHLLMETKGDPLLTRYACIILDEVHERNLNTDALLGVLKSLLKVEQLRTFFCGVDKNNVPLLQFKGSCHPVDVVYLHAKAKDRVKACVEKVVDIIFHEEEGDVLVFLTGQDEIETACEWIEKLAAKRDKSRTKPIKVIPLYSKQPPDVQDRAFQLAGLEAGKVVRKIVVSTNIAETSLTIDGVVYVVDSGYTKVSRFHPGTRGTSLTVTRTSKASARQRMGRAGRTREGTVFRMYTSEEYESMPATTPPDILSKDLGQLLLLLKRIGVDNLWCFDFLEQPDPLTFMRALDLLLARDGNSVCRPGGASSATPF